VTHDVKALLGSFGVARTREVVAAVDRHTIGAWVSSGRLLRPYPGVVVLPERSTDWRTRAIAASLGTRGVLSHTSALTVWRLAPAAGSIHVSVPPARRALRRPGLVVHRVTDIPADQLGGPTRSPTCREPSSTAGASRRAPVACARWRSLAAR
jgi:hypothetical protein